MKVSLLTGKNAQGTGVDRYAGEIHRALREQGHDAELVPFTRRELRVGPYRFGGLVSIWLQRLFRRPGDAGGIVHALDPSAAVPGADVVTVHDLIPETDPGGRTPVERFDWALSRRNALRARHLIAISEATRQEILARWGVEAARVSVVHHGIDHDRFRPTEGPSPHLAAGKPNLVYVGDDNPRKGLTLAVEAIADLRERHGVEARLVRVGPTRFPDAAYRVAARERGVDLVEPGFVPDDALPALYTGADAFLWPTLAEGFGFPPLESMACGTPVVALDTPVNREIVGPLGTYHGSDPRGASEALHRTLREPPAADALVEYAARFTWARAAERTAEAYERTLGTRRG